MKTKPENYNTKNDLQDMMHIIMEEEFLQLNIKLDFINVRQGKARHYVLQNRYRITIPQWTKKLGEHYTVAYMIHELAHCIVGYNHKHDNVFKNKELYLLKKYLNIGHVVYHSKSYIGQAFSNSGQKLFDLTNL